ncbi:MAG: exodeoxyribonuclease VII small subunit [Albidovulum sp.]|nr:exodeoxyribonuclease VII small subunit [Albidovulum sp.]MDE0303558.1 exodeoxyribonuclease VII small subunit [Albidovulum sp.]
MTTDNDISSMSFEEALKELEEVVTKLESENTPLEESIQLYERGNMLKQRCETTLKAAEEKVQIIEHAEGKPIGLQDMNLR